MKPVSAASEVYASLREQIIGLTLVPGTVLSRADLADRYHVSQTPVRDALMRLETEHLVDVFPQYATVVSTIDIAIAAQAHFLRRSLELEIVGLLAETHDDTLIADLKAVMRRQEAAVRKRDLADFSAADAALHARLFEAADVAELLELVRSRSGHLDRMRRLHLLTPGKAQKIVDDHWQVVRAIEAADPDGARDALRKHLSGTLSQADDIKARFPAYFSA